MGKHFSIFQRLKMLLNDWMDDLPLYALCILVVLAITVLALLVHRLQILAIGLVALVALLY